MTWKESFAIGIPEIDNQHKELFERIDNLYAACAQGKGTSEVLETLNFLENYTIEHFADEEKLQLRIQYPKYQQHRGYHTGFINQVASLKKEMLDSGVTILMVIHINNIVSKWLINHIMTVDKELKSYIK